MINNINIDKYRQMFSLDKENILDNYENRVSMIKRRKEKIDWKIRSSFRVSSRKIILKSD